MGYTPEEVDTIRIASMMHDIGKLNLPSSIIEKPGKLTGLNTSLTGELGKFNI